MTRRPPPDHRKTGMEDCTHQGDAESGAILSRCENYRYRLWRAWDRSSAFAQYRTMTFIMLNPSTADGTEDDPTIRRCIGFARSMNCCKMTVVNLYGLRSPKPAALKSAEDPIGPQNDFFIRDASIYCDNLVLAWGGSSAPGKKMRVDTVLATIASATNRPPLCLGLTKDGSPKHPLYIPAATVPSPFQLTEGK